MKLHIYSDEFEMDNEPISLQEAFELLEKQSDQTTVEDNYIGFTMDNDDQIILQFFRNSANKWAVDIPTYENKQYTGALTYQLSHDLVFSLTRDFFDASSLFHKSMQLKNYEGAIEYLKMRYGIVFKFNVKQD